MASDHVTGSLITNIIDSISKLLTVIQLSFYLILLCLNLLTKFKMQIRADNADNFLKFSGESFFPKY